MYKKLLFPVDGSESSRRALPHVRELARAAQATIIVLQAVEIVTEGDAMSVPERRAEAEQSAREIATTLRTEGVEAVESRVVEGDAGRVIVEIAATEDIDLIVMASHGRSAILRVALGSVADYVVRHSPCPILLVRPPREPRPGATII